MAMKRNANKILSEIEIIALKKRVNVIGGFQISVRTATRNYFAMPFLFKFCSTNEFTHFSSSNLQKQNKQTNT